MEKNFEKFLKEYFKKKGINDISKKKNLNLIENGIIDSLDIVTLVFEINKNFKIQINLNNQKSINDFSTFSGLIKLFKKNIK
jgi:acyl carrier protein|tara:strand:+ start:666 stop:911 length:246 start_codon:yes stop_codon:yes gene_type:complete